MSLTVNISLKTEVQGRKEGRKQTTPEHQNQKIFACIHMHNATVDVLHSTAKLLVAIT